MVSLALLLFGDWPWSTDIRVDDATGSSSQNETTFSPFGGGWNDIRTGGWRYGFSGSTDQGETWSANQQHHYTSGVAHDGDPVIGTDRYGRLHEIIMNFDYNYTGHIVHRSSTDMGASWSPFHMVSDGSPAGLKDKPWFTFSVSTDTLYAVYNLIDAYPEGINVSRSTDNGVNWTRQHVSGSTYASMPFVAVDQASNVYVIWLDYYQERYYMAVSTNGGVSYSSPKPGPDCYFNYDNYRAYPVPWIMAGPPGHVYFVWLDERYSTTYEWDVAFSRSTDYGNTWSTPIAINTQLGYGHKCLVPSLALTPQGDLVAVWAQRLSSGNFMLAYAYSQDEGATWHITPSATGRVSDTDFPVSFSQGMQMGDYMTVYADAQYVYALWADDRTTGDYKIYFSKAKITDLIPTSVREEAARRGMGIRQTAGGFLLNLEGRSDVSVEIYDPAGRLVSEVFKGALEPGEHSFTWPSLNQGVYLATIQIGARRTSLKFTAK
ncbi:MAG: exo-alpha-sialidase [candidate division WOR-3 bacterium]